MNTGTLAGIAGRLRALLDVYLGATLPPAPAEVDVGVVLGTEVLPGGRPSRTLEARVLHAAGLYARGRVRMLIPTGGLGKHPPAEAEVMGRVLREEGVPDGAVVLEDLALNTWDSARLVAGMARKLGVRCVLVVTDPLHCVRTVAAFERAGLEAWAEPVYASPMWRGRWSRRGQLARETGALVWYGIRYGVGSRSRP
ncbi:MAG TPA: YdcF family protein [Rubrobacteraceae bacterium]|nr:YdcF family protein [Rubrobacteraceae bacterium]